MSQQLISSVNKQIANWTVMYTKLHNYHWFVTGPQFFSLHEKFEEFYTEAGVHIDELAERLLALEGKPVATLKESLEMASIEEASGNESPDEMVQSVANDFTTMITELKEAMDLAAEVNDETTGDMLLSIHQGLEKHVWMLKSYLGK
ncbi:Dps family protein [Bacillus thermotolerans]|uniref:Non-specific DNA-binding protein Dps n=1 Tax=Bacillus thermotolerans TaxID=1221996 RepID=A0A0F5HXF7_BACTR|nr:Dps family protein [Bacillus thermotolerans]KKB35231.1 Non-specific DNA-binding protein Dps [Bacillus thermotolerans]KKB37517.1 Non-specific DNA-binding protein Dps [Bacillus thermotolerans]KKB42055.1 Non-specific DNA-binding protein Dps [Bacillus thermotolerans]